MRKHAIQSTLYIRTSTYIHGVHRHYSAQPGSFAPPLPHARVPPPTLGRLAMCWPCSTPTPLTRASPASSSGDSGSPASPTATPVAAVKDELTVCVPNHASRERHAQGTAAGRGYRVGLRRGNGPDGRRRPRGCRQRSSETEASEVAAGATRGRSCAPRLARPAVGTGAKYAPARQPSLRPLRPPEDRGSPPPCSNV